MDWYVVDQPTNTALIEVKANDQDGRIVSISKVGDDDDGALGAAQDMMDDGTVEYLSQMVRFFGRNAEAMTVSDYRRSARRVAKRDDDAIEPEVEVDLSADGQIVKTDPDQRVVFGWAYVTHDQQGNVNIDKSGDFIDAVEEIEKSAYDFVLESRSSDADHTNVKGGSLVESIVFTPEKIEKMGLPSGAVPLGWWIGFKIEDDATWERVKKGELTAFSIHGQGTRTKVAPE